MASRTVIAERTIAAPRDAVFEWFSAASNWTAAPLVLSGKLAAPGRDGGWGLGARRTIIVLGLWFDEEIVAYDPPASFDYRIRRSVPPMRRELGRMEFKEVPGGTRVTWTRWVTMPVLLAPILALFTPVGRWVFGHILAAGDRELTRNAADALADGIEAAPARRRPAARPTRTPRDDRRADRAHRPE